MKVKNLGFGAAVPLFALALLGLPNTANAASLSLSDGDTLNVNGAIQLDNFFPGTGDGNFDGLFVPEIGGTDAAPLGELAFANVGSSGNTGGFAVFNNADSGTTGDARVSVRSFNPGCVTGLPGCDVSGFTSSSYFALLDSDATYPSGSAYPTKYVFRLTEEPISSSVASLPTGISFDFSAIGQVQEVDVGVDGVFGTADDGGFIGSAVLATYDFSVQGINLVDPVQGLTNTTTYSGTVIVATDIPEGNNIIGLLSLAGLAAVGMVKGRSTNKSHVSL